MHDFLWVIDKLFYLFFFGIIFLFMSIKTEISNDSLYLLIYLEIIAFLSVFGGKEGLLSKMGYLRYGKGINILTLFLFVFWIGVVIYNNIKKRLQC